MTLALHDDRQLKTLEIQSLDRDLSARLVQKPCVQLLSFPGINLVSAAHRAGDLEPIEHFAHARTITGHAGLCPASYQSDAVDHANGPLVRNCIRVLRAAILLIADNRILYNHYFQHRENQL